MSDEFKNADFLNDEEKMEDFTYLTKEEFLSSYNEGTYIEAVQAYVTDTGLSEFDYEV